MMANGKGNESQGQMQKLNDLRLILISGLFLLCALLLLSLVGNHSRAFSNEPEIIILKSPSQAYKEWSRRKLHGRAVLYVGSELPLKAPKLNLTSDAESNIRSLEASMDWKKVEVRNDNFLYVALLKGTYRKLIWLIPDEDWGERKIPVQNFLMAKRKDYEDYALHEGTPLGLCKLDGIPLIKEPLVVHIDLDLVGEHFESRLTSELEKRNISADLITISASSRSTSRAEQVKRQLSEILVR